MISFNSLPSNVRSCSFSFGANIKNVDGFVFLDLDDICVSTVSVGIQYTLSQLYEKPPFWPQPVPLQALGSCLTDPVLES